MSQLKHQTEGIIGKQGEILGQSIHKNHANWQRKTLPEIQKGE